MDAETEMVEVLRAARQVLPKLVWERGRLQTPDNDARFFEGRFGDWHFVVTSFEIESQGFPPGSRGHDGAATRPGMVLHLTRELAEEAFRLADAAVGEH